MSDTQRFLLSSQQRKIWKQQQVAGQPLWSTLALSIDGAVDCGRLKAALEAVLGRHEALCSTVEQVDTLKYPLQQIAEPQLAWRQITAEDQQPEAIAAALTELQQQPGVSALLVKHQDKHYELLVSVATMFADHRSLSHLFNQLVDHYDGDLSEHDDVQYVDYAQWQEDLLEQQPNGSEYWQEFGEKWQLTAARGVLLDTRVSRRRHRVTPPATLFEPQQWLSHWALVLNRCNPQDQFIVNSLFDGRLGEDFDGAIGAYSQMVPLALSVTENMTVAALADVVAQAQQDGTTYQAFAPPELRVDNRYGFGFVTTAPARQVGGVTFAINDQQVPIDDQGLSLSCTDDGSRQSISIDYDPALYSDAEVANLADMLVISLQAESGQSLDVVNLLGAERRQALYETVSQFAGDSATLCFHQMFEQQVQQHPQQTAIRFDGQNYSYQQLNTDANRLAHYLLARGVDQTQVMAVYLPRSYQLVVSLLAVMKTGGAYCAIDQTIGAERLKFMLGGTAGVITDRSLSERLPTPAADQVLLCVEDWPQQLADGDSQDPGIDVPLGATAYILYTSGSTGKPKGVMVKHLGLANYLQWAGDTYLKAGGNSIVHTSIGFDLTVTSLYTPLLVGGQAYLVADDDNIDNLKTALIENHTTALLKLTPSHLKMLNSWFDADQLPQVHIEVLVVGGESLHCEDLKTSFDSLPNLRVYNEYGPTEATVGCCVAQIGPNDKGNASIGLPIANTALYVLDPAGQLLPPGVIGELFIGGDGVAAGYFGRDDLTEQRFVANTANPEQGGLLYKTGDLVRLNQGLQAQGEARFEFIGRNDRQVKINGFRIELDEIERVINDQPGVNGVAVLTELNHFDENTLVAFVMLDSDNDIEQVTTALADHLPDYMIPERFVALEQFPLTTNGKVDVKKLIADNGKDYRQEQQYVAPTTEQQAALCQVFEQCLKVDKVGINDNFFSLGGDSIRGVQVVAQAQNAGIEFTMQELFKSPTIATLVVEINAIAQHKQQQDDAMTAELLAELDDLSEEEVAELLAASEGEQH